MTIPAGAGEPESEPFDPAEEADPIVRFLAVQRAAAPLEVEQATAAVLATADLEGRPSARVVLVKAAGPHGFVFFTNRASRKGRELELNPWAALCFFWPALARQVRIEGAVEPVADVESDAYFASRPRGSQLGAWASRQSAPLPSRAALEERLRLVEERFAGGPVTRPPHWGGYRLRPARIEFWRGRESRLHDRWLYELDGDAWRMTLLQP